MRLGVAGLIGIIAVGLVGEPLLAKAQESQKVPAIGFLSNSGARRLPMLKKSLRELGYVEGENISFVSRLAHRKSKELPKLAKELVNLKVDVIVAAQGRAGLAAKSVTTTTPIVVVTGGDLVKVGLMSSLARPGGNVTGFSMFSVALGEKMLEVLKNAFPGMSRVAVLWDPDSTTGRATFSKITSAASQLGATIHSMEVRGGRNPDFAQPFKDAMNSGVDAFIVVGTSSRSRKEVLKLIAQTRLPAIYYRHVWVSDGGLMSYAPRVEDLFRLAAGYVDKILEGAKPGDLPGQQATRFYLVVNLKTAKKRGLTIPASILYRADEVIK